MLTERRIQVYLPARDYRLIKARAQEEGKSLAQLLREAARHYLIEDPQSRLHEGYRRLLEGAGAVESGVTDLAERHDETLGEGRW